MACSGCTSDSPLPPTVTGEVAEKESVVLTFETIASMLDELLYTADGIRRFGGHTPRVTGAQSLAAHGIEVMKLRILARHSSDAITRYVSDAPLKALRLDLGLPVQDKLLMTNGSCRILRSRVTAIERKTSEMDTRLSACEQSLQLLLSSSPSSPCSPCYIQNLLSLAIHQSKPGCTITLCGWDYSRQQSLGNVIATDSPERFRGV